MECAFNNKHFIISVRISSYILELEIAYIHSAHNMLHDFVNTQCLSDSSFLLFQPIGPNYISLIFQLFLLDVNGQHVGVC